MLLIEIVSWWLMGLLIAWRQAYLELRSPNTASMWWSCVGALLAGGAIRWWPEAELVTEGYHWLALAASIAGASALLIVKHVVTKGPDVS